MRHWLVQMRLNNNMTQAEAAKQAGISRSYYSGIEVGSRNAPVATAKKIAAALGFDWTLFFADNGRKTSQKKSKSA